VQRYSTTILEQKQKARYVVQCFIQIADFLTAKKKRSLSHFKNHEIMRLFDNHFADCKNRNLLQKMGFKKKYQDHLLTKYPEQVVKFRKVFSYFERSKSKRGVYKVADGINRDAIFCMRDILRELPQIYLTRAAKLSDNDFLEIIKSSYAKKSDLKLTIIRKRKIARFQHVYLDLIKSVEKDFNLNENQLLLEITMRSSIINKYDRVTGDSISIIVQKVGKMKPRLSAIELFELVQQFSVYQNLDPDQKMIPSVLPQRQKNIMQNFHSIVRECREGL
jgi:hypothetical protein